MKQRERERERERADWNEDVKKEPRNDWLTRVDKGKANYKVLTMINKKVIRLKYSQSLNLK